MALNGTLQNASIGEEGRPPVRIALSQNSPNPFAGATTISYSLPCRAFVNLTIRDRLGSIRKTIVRGWQNSGSYSVSITSVDLPPGAYSCELLAAGEKHLCVMQVVS